MGAAIEKNFFYFSDFVLDFYFFSDFAHIHRMFGLRIFFSFILFDFYSYFIFLFFSILVWILVSTLFSDYPI